MSRLHLVSPALALAALSQVAQAVPVTGLYVEDTRCDTLPTQTLTHELGVSPPFPINESINHLPTAVAPFTVCVPDDGNQNDWIVSIQNTSGIPWRDLHFVCNLGATVGNADGTVQDLVGAPNVPTDAFRIDGTVTPGVNSNLFTETMTVDEIFEPGEIWRFNVSNFIPLAGALAMPPNFRTPGVFAGSSPVDAAGNNASILAIPVPEPAATTLLILGAAATLMRRPRRR